MDDIVIKVTANESGIADLNKQLDQLRAANKKLEDQVTNAQKNHKKGTEEQIDINKKLEDQVTNAQKKHKKGTEEQIDINKKLSKGFEEIGTKIAAGFAVEKIIEFGAECVKAFEEAEAAAQQLQFAVENIGKEGPEALHKLSEFTEKLSDDLGNLFSKKDFDKATAVLVKFGLSTDQVTQLLPRLAGAAAQTGVSLEEMSQKVSAAFINGPRALNKELGTTIAASGDQVKQFQLIYKGLADFSDGATKVMETNAGKAQASANKLEKTQEELGSKLAPITEQAKSNFYYNIGNLVDGIKKLFGTGNKEVESGLEKQARLLKEGLEQAKADKEKAEGKAEDIKTDSQGTALQKYLDEIKSYSDKEIEIRIQAAEEEDETIYKKILPKGFKELEAALKKEQDARQKSAEATKALIKQFYADLESIRKKDAEDNAKLSISLIKDEFDKKFAQETENFRKEQEEFESREKKLQDIAKRGNAEQRAEALAELDKLNADKILSVQAYYANVERLNKEHNEKILEQEQANQQEVLRHDKAMYDIVYEQQKEQLDASLAAKKISQEKYNKEVEALELSRVKAEKEADLAADDSEIEFIKQKLELAKQAGEDTAKLDEDLKKAQNKRDEDAAKDNLAIQKQLDADKLAAQKEFAEQVKKIAESVNEIAQTALTAANDVANSNINVINTQLDAQARAIDVQKDLAQKGLDNDLAFEEKRADELTKAKLKEQQKLKKIKELETFLNALANFAEKDPKTALPKALALLAATKAAEAVYAEDGGIIGQIGSRSMIGAGMSRKHKSGNDVLLHAEKGEGILSVKEMNNLGIGNFNMLKSMLKTPFSEKLIPNKGGSSIIVQDNSALLERLDSLEKTIKNKKEVSIDFDEMNQWIKTEVENGVKKVIKHVNPNARRKF